MSYDVYWVKNRAEKKLRILNTLPVGVHEQSFEMNWVEYFFP